MDRGPRSRGIQTRAPNQKLPKAQVATSTRGGGIKAHTTSTMRLTGHLVAETKRRISPNTSVHPVANQTITLRPGATRRTCKIYWKTKQDSQDRSTDHGGAPQHVMMTVTPDILKTNPAGPNTAAKALLSYVVILLNIEAPHTHYASQMK